MAFRRTQSLGFDKNIEAYPNIKEAGTIKDKLEQSFNAENILQELNYMRSHQEDDFEFPYGTSWLMKVAEELDTWKDPLAKKWLKNLQPLVNFLAEKYIKQLPTIDDATYTGDHYSTAFGISFALDYARSVKNDSLEAVCVAAAKKFYGSVTKFPLIKEPFGYDFMSAGLLIADLMRKVLPKDEYLSWLHEFAPDLFSADGVITVLVVKHVAVHDGYAAGRLGRASAGTHLGRPTMTAKFFEIENLSMRFGGLRALNSLDLTVPSGQPTAHAISSYGSPSMSYISTTVLSFIGSSMSARFNWAPNSLFISNR